MRGLSVSHVRVCEQEKLLQRSAALSALLAAHDSPSPVRSCSQALSLASYCFTYWTLRPWSTFERLMKSFSILFNA